MIVGICFPTPGPQSMPLMSEHHLNVLRDNTAASHLRIDIHHARADEAFAHVQHINAHGFKVLPILAYDERNPNHELYAAFCERFVRETQLEYVELGNEPHTMYKMRPASYAGIFRAGAEAIRRTGIPTKILIACEAVKAIGKKIDYFHDVKKHVPSELYDGLAIHPYRNPASPNKRGGDFKSRREEADWYYSQSPGKELHVTEFGWDLRSGVDTRLQAEYVYQELNIWKDVGAVSAFVYNWTEAPPPNDKMFGITDHNFNPRPVCAMIKRFQEEQSL